MTVSSDVLRLDDQLCFAVYAATNAVVRAYRPLLRELGLTYPQYLLLMVLWERDDQAVSEVAARLQLPVHGLLPVVERLERAALVRRSRQAGDRRVVRLGLTAAGAALERAAAVAQHNVVDRTKLTVTELEDLRDQLRHLTAALT